MNRKNKKLVLTDEHLLLISNIKFEKFVFDDKEHYCKLKNLASELMLTNDKNFEDYNKVLLQEIDNFNPHSRFGWGCDQWSLFGGTYVLEDIALILGCFDQALEHSENLPTGRRFPVELEVKMYSLYEYIYENLEDIFTLVLSMSNKGGITPGTYELIDYVWTKKKEA
jgi:hypothetical protein